MATSISLSKLNQELKEVFSFANKGEEENLRKKVGYYQQNDPFNDLIQGDEYPDLHYEIEREDYKDIKEFFDARKSGKETSKFLKDPVHKLLYTVLWKNGLLNRTQTLIEGIEEALDIHQDNRINQLDTYDKRSSNYQSLIFPRLGAHVVDKEKYPLVDQHVIRSYKVYQKYVKKDALTKQVINDIREDSYNNNVEVNKVNQQNVDEYTEWIRNTVSGYPYSFQTNIDKCLFTLGKALKYKRIKIKT